MKKTLLIILILVVLIAGFLWTTYNKLVNANEVVTNQWAQVESQYQRRFDLIPNLVESVKGIMKQEQEVFGKIAEARTQYTGAQTTDQKIQAATQLDGALSRLLVIMENYPQLKSAENVQTLMTQLEGTENRIAVERQRYNDTVKSFNVMIKRLPTNLIANILGFSEKTYFEAQEGTENAPKVEL
ncbi:MAG: LemA family protein [Patescibacteria group bacterium]|nr:LemA family protein [Patescibacteria group bacterium]